MSIKRVIINSLIAFALIIIYGSAQASKIVELTKKGSIGPATADYLSRSISSAQDANLILIVLDTPGGLDKSTRQIIQDILASKVPIVTYVYPKGARAASAGTFLLYASTIAAMAPGTNLGAASPVSLSGDNKEKSGVMDKKVTNDSVAYIRSLAQLRGRNAVFAEQAVMSASTLTANEALKKGVIDLIAENTKDLLSKLDGKTVNQAGLSIQINSSNPEIILIQPDWRMKFLLVITDPTIAYLLLLLGIYGIFFELVNPGFVLPGVIGSISMIIALYGLQLLPVNYAGLALMVIGIGFIITEAFTSSFGVLGVGGTIAFIAGSILLIDTEHQSYQIARSAIWSMAAANILALFTLLGMAIQTRRKTVQHGLSILLNAEGRALNDINLDGQAVIRGEIWSVSSQTPIAANKPLRVVRAEGLNLEVEEIDTEEADNQGGS